MAEIQSKDIFRIAYLVGQGFSLAETKLDPSHRVTFVIQGTGLKEADSRYRTGRALINPLQFRESLNLLRDLIRNTQKPKSRNAGPQTRSHYDKTTTIRKEARGLPSHGHLL